MRTLKQLYTLLLRKQMVRHKGICLNIEILYNERLISSYEKDLLHNHFKNQYPTIFSKFWWNTSFKQFTSRYGYWWKSDEKGQEQRIKFLQHIISKL
jgi:hypothetical protein